jgi:hypothetical protein
MAYTKKSEQDLAAEILEQHKLSKQFLDPIHERFNQQEELYRSYLDPANYPHSARVFDPRIFRVIETITPRMVANEPTGSFYPAEMGDTKGAEILNIMFKHYWRRTGMFKKLVDFSKSSLIFGTSFGRTHWRYEEMDKKRMIPVTVNGRQVWTPKATETIKVIKHDEPDFEVLNIYDCFPDPNSTSIDTMRWFILRRFKTLEELKAENENRGYDYYKNLDKLEQSYAGKKEQAPSNGAGMTEDMYYREHRRTMLSTQEFIGQDASNKDIVILTRFTRDGLCDIVPEFGNLVIREVENPYFHGELPIIHGVDYPYPNELYGMGEIEPIDRIQRAINAVLNQRLDNVQLILRNMWKVKKNAGVDLHTLVSAPGNIITTDDMNAIEPIAIPDATGATFVQTMNYLTSALQNGSGITDYTIGLNTGENTQNETATGTRLIQQEANAQFKLKIQLLNHMVISRIADHWKDLMIQFTTEEQMLRIVGKDEVMELLRTTDLGKMNLEGQLVEPGSEEPRKLSIADDGSFAFLKVYPEDIQSSIVGDFDFIPAISSEQLIDPIALQNNFFQALDRIMRPEIMQGLQMEGKSLNYSGIVKKVFDKLNLGLEEDDILTDAQQQQGTMQQPPEMTPEETQAFLADRGNPLPAVNELGGMNEQPIG